MAKKGIAQITGSKVLKLGEVGHYHISKTYRPEDKAKISHAKWKLYVKENNNWRELKPVAGTPPKIGSETTITITNQKLLGKELLLEAYLYEPEKSSPPGIVIKIEEGKKKIERVDLFRTDDSPISNGDVLKYGQSIIVKVITVNMPNEKVEITLYEDDENGVGHNANNEKNKVDFVEKRLDHDGFAMHTFKLPIDFQRIANSYKDGSQDKFHEYYINVKSATDSKASSNVNLPNPDYTYPEQEIEEVVISVKAKEIGVDPLPETGRSVNVVKEVKIEGLLDAYFAKKEYTKQTGEEAGTVEYTFGGNGNKTSTDAEKEKIAKIIVGKSQITSLKNKKEYTTVEAIKAALTADVYNKDQKITIKTFKLGEEFKRVNSAPLEDKLYLVATTSMLDGKEATIIIKEKDGIIKGSAGAVLPVLEITEEQMEQKTNVGEVQGTEKTEFKGTVQDGMVKIPIHLRPKSDDELKQWKDKLAKGKEDGTYTYTFASQTALPNGSGDEKKRVAQAILTNAKEGKRGNPKIETGKTAFADDIEKALVKEVYLAGQTISFPIYKKETEFLYLQAKAQGEKQHDKEFLKQDGAYFQIGGGKEIIFPLLVKPENDKENKWGKNYYWAAAQGNNMATFNTGRAGNECGTWKRMHAARDLYTNPETEVVAICRGTVLEVKNFYSQTDQVTVLHETNDGRKFIVRYGELAPSSITVKKNDLVQQKQKLGVTGKLLKRDGTPLLIRDQKVVYMLHFELYTGNAGYNIDTPLSNCEPPFARRRDLIEPLDILQEGYRNTFENNDNTRERVNPQTLNFSQNGLDFLKGYETEIKKNGKHVAFDDGYGYCTIGYGHLINGKRSCSSFILPIKFANGLTDKEANDLLFQDVQRISNLVKSKVTVNLYQYEFDALVSLAFNVEAAVGSDSTLLRKLNSQDYEGAADEFKNWKIAGGVVSPGLVKRRAQETDIFKNNIYDSRH